MIRKIILAVLISNSIVKGLVAQSPANDWENPLLYEVNKEVPHASFMLYTDKASVQQDDFSTSPFYHSLNGTWKFNYTAKVKDRIINFYKSELDDSQWKGIAVPFNWEL